MNQNLSHLVCVISIKTFKIDSKFETNEADGASNEIEQKLTKVCKFYAKI